MSTKPPVSLGDSPKKYTLLRELVPLPPTRKEIIQAFESVISKGGVQRVLVQVGRAIEVDRFVPATEEAPPPEEVPTDDLLDRVRNGDLRPLDAPDTEGALTLLLLAFQELSKAAATPTVLYVSSMKSFTRWLGVPRADPSRVFGVEVVGRKDIPEDAAILVGLTGEEAVGIRIPVPELQKATAVTARTKKPQEVLK